MEASQTQTRQPQQADQGADAATLGALTVILLAGLPVAEMAAMTAALLAPLGISSDSTAGALALLGPHLEAELGAQPATASAWVAQTANPRRAAYLVNAAKRIQVSITQPGPDGRVASIRQAVAAERRYLAQHLGAERGRVAAARQVDDQRGRHGDLLGWYARMDDHTSPGCRAQHGTNFNPASPPLVEGHPAFPGMVHPECRCKAGAPHTADVREPARVLVGAGAALSVPVDLAFDPTEPRDAHGRWLRVGSAIKDLFSVTSSRYVAYARDDAVDAIGKVHAMPEGLPSIPVEKDDGTLARLRADGGITRSPEALDTPERILLQQESTSAGIYTMNASLVHEIGHYLDLTAFRDDYELPVNPSADDFYASKWAEDFQALRLAFEKSEAIQEIRRIFAKAVEDTDLHKINMGRYLLRPHEMFARAYLQWIAIRSGDAKLLEALARMREDGLGPQWSDADFEEIARELDTLFRKRGWLR